MSDLVLALRRKLEQRGEIPVHTRIALERALAGLGLRHCARAMKWPTSTWQRLEAGERRLSEEELARVAQTLGVTDARLRGLQATTTPGKKRPGRPARLAVAA